MRAVVSCWKYITIRKKLNYGRIITEEIRKPEIIVLLIESRYCIICFIQYPEIGDDDRTSVITRAALPPLSTAHPPLSVNHRLNHGGALVTSR